jgi:hypothetical protein
VTVADVLARSRYRRIGGRYYRIPCPLHGTSDFNCSVWDEQGSVRFKCWSHSCSPRDIEAALGGRPITQSYGQSKPAKDITAAQRTEAALKIWHQSVAAEGTPVETYLRNRAITLPVPPSLRFHARLWHPIGTQFVGMVGAIQNIKGEIVAVHRTYLEDNRKADLSPNKMMLGRCAGSAIRFAPAAEALIICEGIETGLSAMQATGLPTWCALSASGLTTIQLPPIVRTVLLAVDHDVASGAGDAAAMRASDRFLTLGLQVRIARPVEPGDFNDVLRG